MAKKLTKVNVNSITIKDSDGAPDPQLLFRWDYDQKIEGEISELVLECKKNVVDTVSLKIGQTIDVWEGFSTSTDTKVFAGSISSFKLVGGTYEIVCRDKMYDLVKQTVSETYLDTGTESGVVSAIAEDMIETHGGLTATVVASGSALGQTIAEFRGDHKTIFERLQKLAKAVKYQLFYNSADDTVHFEPRGFTNNGVVLTVAQEIVTVPDWEDDDSMMVNDLRIDGAIAETKLRFPESGAGEIGVTANFATTGITIPHTPQSAKLTLDSSNPPTTLREGGGTDSSTTNFFFVDKENFQVKPADGTTFSANDFAFVEYDWFSPHPIHMLRQESIDEFGLYKTQMNIDDIKSIADAESRTKEILDRFSSPFKIGKFKIKDDNTVTIRPGDQVSVIDTLSTPNINDNFVVTRIRKNWPGGTQDVIVGDEAIKLADWQVSIEERLKRIETQNIVNQDLTAELRDFFFNVTNQPRYVKLTTEDYDDTSDVSIWGLGSGDGYFDWGSGKWGDHDAAFEDPVDHFIQQFENNYKEPFLDTDFKDTSNTTATWTNTGSLDFTELQTSLLSYYKMDESSGTLVDSHGSNDGTVTGATYSVTGKINTALSFDGIDDKVVLGDDISTASAGSIAFWIKPANDSLNHEIYEAQLKTASNDLFRILLNSSYQVSPQHYVGAGSTNDAIRSTVALTTGIFNHVVVTASGTAWKVYINGIEDTSLVVLAGSNTGAFLSVLSGAVHEHHLMISTVTGSSTYGEGDLDEFGIWERVLSQEDVTKLYNSGSGKAYGFSEIGQSTSVDFNNGTITTAKLTATVDSGTIDLAEMTADGTNFETVTSGTAHTFTNPGTDLRMRITSDDAIITEVLVTDYH